MNSEVLEQLIESYRFIGTHASEREQRAHAFARMAELIAQRSLERIAEMEAKIEGLRH